MRNLPYTISGTPSGAVASDVQGSVPSNLQELSDRVDFLQARVETLVQKIDPVLSPELPSDPSKTVDSILNCVITRAVHDQVVKIDRTIEFINSVINRVQL